MRPAIKREELVKMKQCRFAETTQRAPGLDFPPPGEGNSRPAGRGPHHGAENPAPVPSGYLASRTSEDEAQSILRDYLSGHVPDHGFYIGI